MTDHRSEIALPVVGMTCASCNTHVDAALKGVPGVLDAAADEAAHRVRIGYDPSRATIKDLVRAIEDLGYLVMNPELTLDVQGMNGSSSADQVASALQALPGVEDVKIDVKRGTVRIKYVASALSLPAMQQAVKQAGYDAEAHRDPEPQETLGRKGFPWGWKRRSESR